MYMPEFKFFEDKELLLRETHVVLSSGRHGSDYFNKRMLALRPKRAVDISLRISDRFRKEEIELVVGVEKGATAFGFEVARLLNAYTETDVLSVTAEKTDGGFVIPDYFRTHVEGKRTLLVEDVITTGGSSRRALAAAEAAGVNVIAVACILNRGEITAEDLEVPMLFSCLELSLPDWPADDCPLCREGLPINTDLGHGAEFLANTR